MFTTANGFHLALTIQPVNSPTTFLSRTTLSSWYKSLPVFLIALVMNPTYLIFSLLLILLLILLNSFLLWVHPITFFISVSCSVSSSLPQERTPPSARRRLWHFGAANWSDLRLYFSDFPWNDYCFRGRD